MSIFLFSPHLDFDPPIFISFIWSFFSITSSFSLALTVTFSSLFHSGGFHVNKKLFLDPVFFIFLCLSVCDFQVMPVVHASFPLFSVRTELVQYSFFLSTAGCLTRTCPSAQTTFNEHVLYWIVIQQDKAYAAGFAHDGHESPWIKGLYIPKANHRWRLSFRFSLVISTKMFDKQGNWKFFMELIKRNIKWVSSLTSAATAWIYFHLM